MDLDVYLFSGALHANVRECLLVSSKCRRCDVTNGETVLLPLFCLQIIGG